MLFPWLVVRCLVLEALGLSGCEYARVHLDWAGAHPAGWLALLRPATCHSLSSSVESSKVDGTARTIQARTKPHIALQ